MRPQHLEQRAYYERIAAEYDDRHPDGNQQHGRALRLIAALTRELDAESVLDVGTGTGRGIAYLREHAPDLGVHGIEPVAALTREAVRNGVPAELISEGRGESLPFEDESFDVAMALGVLHHVPDPSAVVGEMMRVARKAVCISDANRFGRGWLPVRLVKLLLARAGLWRAAFWLRTGGRGYLATEDDGVAYSYSAYDSFSQLAGWTDDIRVIGTPTRRPRTWAHPLLTCEHVLLVAVRQDGSSEGKGA
jgi:ubiquinone/menaquinone biosynthesis C-methylase UbiE